MNILNKLKGKVRNNKLANKLLKRVIKKAAQVFDVDLLRLAHENMGILNYRNTDESGEKHLISVWLTKFLKRNSVEDPFFLDIGANKGSYAKMLLGEYPEAQLLAFEPNPQAFEQCRITLDPYPQAQVRNIGLGAEESNMELHIPENEEQSCHSSLYTEVLNEQHAYTDSRSHEVQIRYVDELLHEGSEVHFAKIDTEGHEYDVLKGATHSIEAGNIWSIQFEFNEMNVVSRVFLRDYFQLLDNYNFYRLLSDTVKPIEYDPRQEIFKFQNILAVHNSKDFNHL